MRTWAPTGRVPERIPKRPCSPVATTRPSRGAWLGLMRFLLVPPRQNGTEEIDECESAALAADGSIVLGGYSLGLYGASRVGDRDFVVIMLDADGEGVAWAWQVSCGNLVWLTAEPISVLLR